MRGDFARNQVKVAEETAAKTTPAGPRAGTVTAVSAATLTADVLIQDGSGLSVPCLVASNVHCIANDRVIVEEVGPELVVTQVLGALRGLGANGIGQACGTGNAPNGSWGNIPGTPQFTFVKRWNATKVRWMVSVGCYTSALGLTIQSGITYNAGSTTVKTGHYTFANNGGDPALDAHNHGHVAWETGLAAGTYTVTGRWRADGLTISTDPDWWVTVEGVEYV